LEDLIVNRVERFGYVVEMLGPRDFPVLVHEGLGCGDVLNPDKTVVFSLVAEPSTVHLSAEPFPAVEADLNIEREPLLQASVHEAEQGMDGIVIEMQALSPSADEFELFGLRVQMCPEREAGFDTAEHADETLLDTILEGYGKGRFLLIGVAGLKVDERS